MRLAKTANSCKEEERIKRPLRYFFTPGPNRFQHEVEMVPVLTYTSVLCPGHSCIHQAEGDVQSCVIELSKGWISVLECVANHSDVGYQRESLPICRGPGISTFAYRSSPSLTPPFFPNATTPGNCHIYPI